MTQRPDAAQERYLGALPFCVMAIESDFRTIYVNPAAEAWLGVSSAHCVDLPFSHWLWFDPLRRALAQRVLHSGEAVSLYEHTLYLPHGPALQVTLHAQPVFSGNTVAQLLLIVEPERHARRLAEQAMKKEAVRASGLMAAQLAHEVKNPLSSIRGAAQLLREDASAALQPLAELICMETDRISGLLSQIEVFDDGAAIALRPVNIHEVLRHVILVAQTGFAGSVMFCERYDPSLPEVLGQRDLLVQLFLNLVKNAAEAMDGQPDAMLTISTAYAGGQLQVAMHDNGPGIDAAMRPVLFAPFASSKAPGRGLGLAIVSKIAGDLGATVELVETDGRGAAFQVTLRMS